MKKSKDTTTKEKQDTNYVTPGVDYGLDVMERFVYSVETKINNIQKDLFYLKQWLKLTQEGTPTVMKIKSHKGQIRTL